MINMHILFNDNATLYKFTYSVTLLSKFQYYMFIDLWFYDCGYNNVLRSFDTHRKLELCNYMISKCDLHSSYRILESVVFSTLEIKYSYIKNIHHLTNYVVFLLGSWMYCLS